LKILLIDELRNGMNIIHFVSVEFVAMNRSRLAAILVCAAFCVCATSVNAASVHLIPTSSVIGLEDAETVTVDVVIDFSAEGGTMGGGLDISFDPSAIGLVSLIPTGVGDPAFSRAPDDLGNVLESWAIGSFNGVSSAQAEILGTLEFEVLPTMGLDTLITIGGTNGIGGPWISNLDFLSELSPNYNQVELSRSFVKDGFEN
jgi:hypothetical protein